MGYQKGFVLILQSGAGGYLGCFDEADACDHASYVDGEGWIFRFEANGYASGRHRSRRPLVKLRQVSTLGCPSPRAMPMALENAGMRHGVDYLLDQG